MHSSRSVLIQVGLISALSCGTVCSRAQDTVEANPLTPTQKLSPQTPIIKPATGPAVILPMILSYRPWKGLIVIDALVNGNNPSRFVIATGLNMSTVAPDEVTRLQLAPSDIKAHVAVLDSTADAPTANIKQLRLGPGIIHDIPVAQVNLISLLSKDLQGDAPTCWLGYNFLSHYMVTFDFESHAVILNKPDAPFSKERGTIVPFKLKDGKPMVKVTMTGGGTFDAIVDTGSVGTLIPATIAQKITSKKLDHTPKTTIDIANGKMARMMAPSIGIGKSELKSLMVIYYGTNAPATTDKTMAVIGMDFLRHFRVAISYSKLQIQILPLQSAVNPPPE